MDISVEVSLYPLQDKYLPVIEGVVDRLNSAAGVKVRTNCMSTQITGPVGRVFALIQHEVESVFSQGDKAVFVMKVLNGEMDLSWTA